MKTALADYAFETGIYRPPSEGGSDSLLVRFTRNCPWNHCTFCAMYKAQRFTLRPAAQLRADIDAIARLCRDLRERSAAAGEPGAVTREGAIALLARHPELETHPGFVMVYNWCRSGGRTAFLQDADTPIMKRADLVSALEYLRSRFPSIARVTSYARAKTLARKSDASLAAIRRAGLDRLHLGLESGDDAVLTMVRKGVTADEQITAGRKVLAAGFELSEYWMPGLGGRALSEGHARHTAQVLNAINPDYIRSRPFRALPGTPLARELADGGFVPLTPGEQLREIGRMVSGLTVTSRLCFDHAGNYWKNRRGGYLFSHRYEGYKLPEQRQEVLALVAEGLTVGTPVGGA